MLKYYLTCLLLASFFCKAENTANIEICYEQWTPFAYTEDGEITGSVVNKFYQKAEKLSLGIHFEELPYKRCVELVRAGKKDFALFVDKEDKLTLLEQKIVTWKIAIASKPSLTLNKLSDLEKIENPRFLIALDYQYPPLFLEKLAKYHAVIATASYYTATPEDDAALFNYIIKGSVDLMFIDVNWAKAIIARHQLPINISSFIFHSEPQYIGYGNTSAEKILLMKNLIKDFK